MVKVDGARRFGTANVGDFLRKKGKKKGKEVAFPPFQGARRRYNEGQSIFVRNEPAPRRLFDDARRSARAYRRRPRFQSSWFQEERFEHI
jgi:hypothetical protein